MPSTSYARRDHAVRITAAGETAEISLTTPEGATIRTPLPRDAVDRAARGDDADLRAALTSWGGAPQQGGPTIGRVTIGRVTIEVGERAWAAIAFESFLPPDGWLVRTSPVYPRVLQIPLAFPIRILETGGPAVVRDAIEQTFHGTHRADAFVDAQTTLGAAETFTRENAWPTVEILHVHDLVPGPSALSTARGSEPGTVGWFLRFADRFQTRLVVIEADPPDLPRLRVAAQSIIDRGGPAVWLFVRSVGEYWQIYGEIAHDRPLDWIRPRQPGELFAGAGAEDALRYSAIGDALGRADVIGDAVSSVRRDMAAPRTGAARTLPRDELMATIADAAQAMRITIEGSTIRAWDLWGTRAARLGNAISTRLTRKGLVIPDLDVHFSAERDRAADLTLAGIAQHVETHAAPLGRLSRDAAADLVSSKLSRIGAAMSTYAFEDHESDGMLPLAGQVADARAVADVLRAGRRPRASRKPRHVNTSFSTMTPDGGLQRLPQATSRLTRGELVHFGVRIAPKDAGTVSLGSTRFLEEQVRWEGDGAWIEVGVTAIDFDLVGDPVQEVWLPRDQPTDLVTFAVRPHVSTTVPGVARLRVAIYHRNNVVQSFLVAALLDGASGDLAPALARALNATARDVRRLGDVGYVARLEYATASVGDAASTPARGLAIIANESAGNKVVTLKGDDLFTVSADPTLPEKVQAARDALDRASRSGATYRYTFQQQSNHGNPAELLDVLWDVAEAGFDLFNLLVRDPDDQQRVPGLIAAGGGLHAAHIDASKGVIPWSLVYDRAVIHTTIQYENSADANAPVHQVASAVCPASMPAEDGTMPDVACGSANCLLNAASNEQRKHAGDPIYLEHTVICPRRFWGFMVPIEVPAQQVDGITAGKARPAPLAIKASRPITVVGGFNPNLEFAAAHAEDLDQRIFTTVKEQVETRRARLVRPAQSGPEPLRQLLLQPDPDIVYFFCHALASLETAGKKKIGPSLDFGRGFEGVVEDVLAPRQFVGGAWAHAPLVFINGCSTAGFSPYAPSEFIKQFIQGRRASAVIGTEVTVWEMLATEVAKSFLRHFLDRRSAGDALLRARRALLAKHNPLGLAYTLYGSADLTLETA